MQHGSCEWPESSRRLCCRVFRQDEDFLARIDAEIPSSRLPCLGVRDACCAASRYRWPRRKPAEACIDFDEFVNGAWKKAMPMPPDRGRIGTFDTLRDQSSHDPRAGACRCRVRAPQPFDTPGKRFAATFYASGMDDGRRSTAADSNRLEPLLDREIDALNDRSQLATFDCQIGAPGHRRADPAHLRDAGCEGPAALLASRSTRAGSDFPIAMTISATMLEPGRCGPAMRRMACDWPASAGLRTPPRPLPPTTCCRRTSRAHRSRALSGAIRTPCIG